MITIKNTCALQKYFIVNLDGYWELPGKLQWNIMRSSIDYIFKFIGATDFRNELRKYSDSQDIVKVQRNIISKGFLTKDLKIHLLRRSLGLNAENLGESNKIFNKLSSEQVLKLRKLAEGAILNKKELDDLLLLCIEECRVYMRKFVNKKMKFLMKTKTHTLEDICNLLFLECLQSLLFVYPRFKSELHAVNTMKTIIKNVGKNYIETHTRQKRNHYSDSHTIKVQSLYAKDSQEILNNLYADSNGKLITQESDMTQLEYDVHEVVGKYKGRKAKIIQLLMGNYDEDFSEYLINRNVTKYTNDLYFEHANLNRYMQLIFKYLDYDEVKGYAFVEKLKTKLGDLR